ncbi:MAG TPA: hypothetical protein VIZ28_12560 [Chitinophagaceae bacterium]
MSEPENIGSFFKENKKLVKDYFDTRLEIYKLKMIRLFSRAAGRLIWLVISLFLLFLFIIFCGLVTGFWLSELTGSYVKGFGITTLIILFLIILVTLLRNQLFVNPIIRTIIRSTADDKEDETAS